MNILVFSTVFYPAVGGIENQTLILIQEFKAKGHQVKVITYQKEKTTLPGIEICYAPEYRRFVKLFQWCDTYYMPNISLKGLWLKMLNPGKKWVISHNDFHFFHREGTTARLKSFFTKFATINISVSESIANGLGTKSVVIQNCYDQSVFKLYPEEKRHYDFVFLGRLVTQKGCDLLLEACKNIEGPFTLGIIGIGAEGARLQTKVKELGLDDKVRFLGLLKGEDLARELNRYRHMVIPSMKGEGFGMVALEGLACGCKIIAANAAGLSDAVGEHGEKFEMGSKEGLERLLEKALASNNKQWEKPMTESLNNYLKSHYKANVASRYLEVLTPAKHRQAYYPAIANPCQA